MKDTNYLMPDTSVAYLDCAQVLCQSGTLGGQADGFGPGGAPGDDISTGDIIDGGTF